MCVIIINQDGKTIPLETLKTSARINPHGLGIVWLDTYEVSYHNSKEFKLLDTGRPFIAHFRYATVGAVNKSNTHPFKCGNNDKELLMMNGTIKGLGDKKNSDSKVLAEQLGQIPRNKWKGELEKHLCRFVTINTRNRTYQIYNKFLWTQRDGIWYSKDNVLEDNLIAVYGTLKKGYSNYHSYLTNSKFVGSGKTKDKYPLIIQGLPYLIEEKGIGHKVEVDVFKVSDAVLASLDRLEGHPHWYRRKQVPVMVYGKQHLCWIYFNIKEKSAGKVFHETYKQTYKRLSWWDNMEESDSVGFTPKQTYQPTVSKIEQQLSAFELEIQDCEECDFDPTKELPMCVECYNDLQFDGFSNYHCSSCGSWFTENEILYRSN